MLVTMMSHSKRFNALRLILAISLVNDVSGFFRYIVALQGGAENPASCPPPIPTINIDVAAPGALRTVETTDGTTCTVEDGALICSGSGSFQFDVFFPDDNVFDAPVSMTMNPPTEFFACSAGLPVAQAYSLGLVCPDGTVDAFNVINCSPAESFRLGPTSSFCVSSCTTAPCTQNDLSTVSTNIQTEGCIWDPSDAPPTETSAPTLQPTSSPPPVPAPTDAPATCAGYLEDCVFASDCCTDRCVARQCRKAIPNTRTKIADGRGGAGGVAKAQDGRRLSSKPVRGAK